MTDLIYRINQREYPTVAEFKQDCYRAFGLKGDQGERIWQLAREIAGDCMFQTVRWLRELTNLIDASFSSNNIGR